MDISDNLKKLRVQYGLLQKQVAEAIGIHPPNYSKIEKGERQLTVDMLIKLSKLYECTIEEILYLEKYNSVTKMSVKDRNLLDKLKLISNLEPKDQETIINVIDTVLTKNKLQAIIDKNLEL